MSPSHATRKPPVMTAHESHASGDHEPPEVETRRLVRRISEPTSQLLREAPPPLPPPIEQPLRPILRPSVPVLTVLDDGSFEAGEELRIRSARFVIGRSAGDLMLANDRAMSSTHAEIRRADASGQCDWYLHDLDTSNGTFVRVQGGRLTPHTILTLGLRRFVLGEPFAELRRQEGDGTRMLDSSIDSSVWPLLQETCEGDAKLSFPLRKATVTIGRKGGGCDIQIDDPHLAPHHATLEKAPRGGWRIKAEPTENGTWLSLAKIKLTPHCFFRCGEQFFRFVIP